MRNTAVFFHYYNLNQDYHDNLIYFLSVAWRKDYDFYIIDAENIEPLNLPNLNNVFKIRVKNKNFDYGGYSQAIDTLGKSVKNYKHLFFINSSVRGPFLNNPQDDWAKFFLSKLKNNVHLVGSSINILSPYTKDSINYQNKYGGKPPFAHVQTTAYAITEQLFAYLQEERFYRFEEKLPKSQLIAFYEIGLSQAVMNAGYNIDCVLPKYSGINYKSIVSDINQASRFGDPLRRGAYFGRTAQATELIFIKTNRRLISSIKLAWITNKGLEKEFNKAIKEWDEYKDLKKRTKRKLLQPLYAILLALSSVFLALLT